MSFKTTSHLAAYHTNTYMEQFCKALHPDLEMGKVCVDWFRQAIEHCTDLLSDVREPTSYFWSTVKNFIFPDRKTEITSQIISINIHPKRLTMRDCHTLFLDIVSDYVQRAPRYAAESVENSLLWQVFYSLLGFMVLGTFFLGTVYVYYKYSQPKNRINFIEEFLKPVKQMQAIASKSLRLAKTELRILKIKPIPSKEKIVAADGSGILVLKVGTKYEFLESVVQGGLDSVGKFHRLYDQHNKTKTNFKKESVNKAMQFLDKNCQKLQLVLMFEDDKEFENKEEETAKNRLKNSPRDKSLSPISKTSPRFITSTPKQIFGSRLEGGNAQKKQSSETSTTGGKNSGSPTPKKQNTPRSSTTPRSSSGIPLSARKSK